MAGSRKPFRLVGSHSRRNSSKLLRQSSVPPIFYSGWFFGPVACSFKFATSQKRFTSRRKHNLGLAASAWTTDPAEQEQFINEIEAGVVFTRQREEKVMKRALRDKRTMEGHPIEEVFADFEAMQPAEGERRTRKPAKATINSAGTKSQRDAATRARKTATPTTARAKKSIARAKDRTL